MEYIVIGSECGLSQVAVEKFHSIGDLDGAGVCYNDPLAPVMFKWRADISTSLAPKISRVPHPCF